MSKRGMLGVGVRAVIRRDPVEVGMRRAQEAAAAKLARPVAGKPHGRAVPIEIREQGELVTIPGLETYGAPLRAMRSLDPFQIDAGVRYGGMCAELESSGIGGSDLLAVGGGGGGGCEGAVDRRIGFRDLLDRARVILAGLEGLSPKRAARPAKGKADLGRKFGAARAQGEVIVERQEISARRLVDMVCVVECSVSQVLAAHGWATSSRSREKATAILSHALKEIASDWGGGVAEGHRSPHTLVKVADSTDRAPLAGKPVERCVSPHGTLFTQSRPTRV